MTEPAPKQPLRVCNSCRGLTPSDKAQCSNCGALSADIATTQHENSREREFAEAFFSKATPFTWLFFGINILMYVLTGLASGPEPHVLMAMGAKVNYLINAGQFWRLVTPIFNHAGLLHLLFNSYALYQLGPVVERLYGSTKFVALYMGAGIASIFASYLIPTISDLPSVGASGALFGLLGVLTVFGYKYRDELPGLFKKAFGARLLPIILINLVIGLIIPSIDNSAHLGGLISGGLLTLVIPYGGVNSREGALLWRVLQVALLMLIPLCFFKVKTHYDGPPLSIKQFDPGLHPGDRTEKATIGLDEASKAFGRAFNRRDPDATLPGITGLKQTPDVKSELDELRDRMIDILGRLQMILKEAADKGVQPDENVLAGIRCQHDKWIDDYKKAGHRIGLGWEDDPDELITAGPACKQ